MTLPADLAHGLTVITVLVLVALLILSVVNTRYVRRTLDEQVRLMRRMSEAITWLVDDAQRDIKDEAEQTRQEVKEQVAGVKQKIDESVKPTDGGHP